MLNISHNVGGASMSKANDNTHGTIITLTSFHIRIPKIILGGTFLAETKEQSKVILFGLSLKFRYF